MSIFYFIFSCFAAAAADPPPAPSVPASLTVVGITEPFRVATLASVQPARIAEIKANEGAFLSQGEVVVSLDDSVQRARTELAKAAMESSLPVDLEHARLTRAQRDVDWYKRLQGGDFASSKELNDALSALEIAKVEYELAVFNQQQAARAYQRERETLAEFHLRAPFPAYVAGHIKHAGETVDPLEGIVKLVQLDPLTVSVDCPLELAPFIAVGGQFLVCPTDSRWKPRPGTVAFAAKTADAASQTFKVKLTVSNEDHGWMGGIKVMVDFAAERVGSAKPAGEVRREESPGADRRAGAKVR